MYMQTVAKQSNNSGEFFGAMAKSWKGAENFNCVLNFCRLLFIRIEIDKL